jgi:hypothetical protein
MPSSAWLIRAFPSKAWERECGQCQLWYISYLITFPSIIVPTALPFKFHP